MTSPLGSLPTEATFSWRRNVTLLRRRMNCSASPISPSRNVSTRGRWSTTVTFVPRRPNIERVLDADHAGADDGHAPRQALVQVQQPVGVDHVLVVELHVLRPRRGTCPTAMMMLSAVTCLAPSSSVIETVCSSSN